MTKTRSAGRQPGAETSANRSESTRRALREQEYCPAPTASVPLPVALLDEVADACRTVHGSSRTVAGAMKLFVTNGGIANTFYTALLCGVLDDAVSRHYALIHRLQRARAVLEVSHMDYRAGRLLAEQRDPLV